MQLLATLVADTSWSYSLDFCLWGIQQRSWGLLQRAEFQKFSSVQFRWQV